jgi:geranylgeranyl pyrophosphate synthase
MVDVSLTPLAQDRETIDGALRGVVQRELAAESGRVVEAVRYALQGSGKRVRGSLLLAAYRACGGHQDVSSLAAAVEIVHAYSLVHDDLPCMDDDAMRRGRPTVHMAFDVETATLAGVAMVPLAVRVAMSGARDLQLPPPIVRRIVRDLMHASGASGMVGGQWLDLDAEGEPTSLEELERMHRMKTGALLAVSARIGALAAHGDDATVEAMARFGADVGLAFQIVDDVLDVTSGWKEPWGWHAPTHTRRVRRCRTAAC